MTLLNLKEVASSLNISKASVKNWEKHGYIKEVSKNLYSPDDVNKLKELIKNGEIDRLKNRANKTESKAKFIPTEYIYDNDSLDKIEKIVDFIIEYNIKPEQAIFLLSINLLNRSCEFESENLRDVVKLDNPNNFKRVNIFNELNDWYGAIGKRPIDTENRFCKFLLDAELPNTRDVLGVIYQSVINEGKKSKLGSYYTPLSIVEDIVESQNIDFSKVLDPCCGTGQFLIKMAEKVANPEAIWGLDIDPVAVRIAKINLFLAFNLDFKPKIYNLNSLIEFDESGFSFIGTNPPWGAKISSSDLKELRIEYPEVKSKESFSFFLNFALNKLKNGGNYSYVLPESLLYVKNHSDIRSMLLNNSQLNRVKSYGRAFKNVFSSVITLEGTKKIGSSDIEIMVDNISYLIPQNRFLANHKLIMDINCTNKDQEIINKVYSLQHKFLSDQSKWALGIVTGNNKKFLVDIEDISNLDGNLEPVYRGREIERLKLKTPAKFISFRKGEFQQCAPENLYRADEKLIYKFISNNLCFAYDDKKSLTLNSANILIPVVGNYSVKAVGALLNSCLYNFILWKKVRPLKMLRSDIEILPFPNLEKNIHNEFNGLIDLYLAGSVHFKEIDKFIYSIFSLNEEEIKYIEGTPLK